jgi:glycosyltransferase involved in cell wall biosynthesis
VKPLVSVVITNYDYGRFLDDAIGSVHAQSYEPIEIVVVDDASTDDSWTRIEGYGDALVKRRHERTRGQLPALSTGIEASSGDIVCFLDADDVWHPEKVARVVQALDEHGADWAHHKLRIVGPDLAPTGQAFPLFRSSGRVPGGTGAHVELRARGITSATSARRRVLEPLFPLPADVPAELTFDADVYLCLGFGAQRAGGYALDEVLGYYREHRAAIRTRDVAERQVRIGAGITKEWERLTGERRVPTFALKHALAGDPRGWVVRGRRLRLFGRGLREVAWLARESPTFAARQLAGLAFAFFLPGAWMRGVLRKKGVLEIRARGA